MTSFAAQFRELYRFTSSLPSPSGMIWGGDGALYGTCFRNGENNLGFVFRVETNGLLTTLVSFAGTNGANPSGKLVLGNDGLLYGTTENGGLSESGTIFRVTTNGSLQTITTLSGTNSPNFGAKPVGLCLGHDGAFYGCTRYGGIGANTGVAYRITSDGTYATLVTFSPAAHGFSVNGNLVEAQDHAFYGTTQDEGPAGRGTIFRLTLAGDISVIASFNGTNGGQPLAPLTVGTDGVLYGTTYSGGLDYNGAHRGTVFRCTTNGQLSTLHNFVSGPSGYYPNSSLVQASDGVLYGSTQFPYSDHDRTQGTLFSISTNGAWTNILTFNLTNGAGFTDSPVLAKDGSFYGTTAGGGPDMAGMVFRFDPEQRITPVAPFRCGPIGTSPNSLFQTADGLFYGTTSSGGTNNVGTVLSIDTNGSILFSASLQLGLGSFPSSPLIPGPAGFLYGLARQGGTFGFGSIYRISTNTARFEPVASFNKSNGSEPMGPFYVDPSGNIFGLTFLGGAYDQGTVFRADTNGVISVIVSFTLNGFPVDAAFPRYGLMHASDGAFYATSSAGSRHTSGSLIRVTTNGTLTVIGTFSPLLSAPESVPIEVQEGVFYGTSRNSLFRFTSKGAFSTVAAGFSPWPQGPLTLAPDGAFYGVGTGSDPNGGIFRLTTNGVQYSLMSFDSYVTGGGPSGGLILGLDGKFYGTTGYGQTFDGNIFSLDLTSKLGPPTYDAFGPIIPFSGTPGALYQVQQCFLLGGAWSNVGTARVDRYGRAFYRLTSTPSSTNSFYRLKLQ